MKPNILLIHAHDLGQHIEPYGATTVSTPNLSRLAREGTLFRKSFCTHPTCSPSRAALFTGRYPHATGVLGLTHGQFQWSLNPEERHMAQLLSDRGFRTGMIGGFHEHHWDDAARLGYMDFREDQYGPGDGGFRPAAETAAATEEYLSQLKRDADGTPFFLSVGLFEPHRPFDYGGAEPDRSKGVALPNYLPQETNAERQAAEQELAAAQGAISQMDDAVGRILAALSDTGFEENTVVLFTSDHGLALPRAKGTLYDSGIEVPCIMRGPGIEGGRKVNGPISNVDYLPTLLEMIDGTPVPTGSGGGVDGGGPPLQGVSFWPYLSSPNGAELPRKWIFAEKNFHAIYDPIRAIRTNRYKYIVNLEHGHLVDVPGDVARGMIFRVSAATYYRKRAPYELYDLERDPGEEENLAGLHSHREIEEEMKELLVAWMRRTGDFALDGPPQSVYNRLRIGELTG